MKQGKIVRNEKISCGELLSLFPDLALSWFLVIWHPLSQKDAIHCKVWIFGRVKEHLSVGLVAEIGRNRTAASLHDRSVHTASGNLGRNPCDRRHKNRRGKKVCLFRSDTVCCLQMVLFRNVWSVSSGWFR